MNYARGTVEVVFNAANIKKQSFVYPFHSWIQHVHKLFQASKQFALHQYTLQ